MSKPDPSITANLLGSLTPKASQESRTTVTPAKPGHAERHPAPVGHKSGKPAPSLPAAGRTRTSNRGK